MFAHKYIPRSTFQQTILRSVNDKNAQLQKQLDSVVREGDSHFPWLIVAYLFRRSANGEINLLNAKMLGTVTF